MNSTNHFIQNLLKKNLHKTYGLKNQNSSIPQLSLNILKKFLLNSSPRNSTTYDSTPLSLGSMITTKEPWGKRLYISDINSLYPFSFLNKLPSPFHVLNQKLEITAACITPPNFTRFPYFFSAHKFLYYLIPYELTYLKKLNYEIIPVNKILINYSTTLFTDFTIHIYKNKLSHPSPSKYIINSFYGKLLRRNNIYEDSKFYPAIKSMISYARILTHNIRSNPTNPSLYSDIDSFATRHPNTITFSREIGHLKFQSTPQKFNYIDFIDVKAKRNYLIKSNNKHSASYKGHTHNKTTDYTFHINGKPVNSVQIIGLNIINTIINVSPSTPLSR